jgi:hypothetical protein
MIGIWQQKRAVRGSLSVSVSIVFATFTEISFIVCIFSTIVTPKCPTKVIAFKSGKTGSLSVEIIA